MERKPRVLITITTFYPFVGGAETQTLAQCQHMINNEHQVQVFTFHHKHHWPKHEMVNGVPVKRIARLLLGRREKLPRPIQKLLYLIAMIAMSWAIWRERKNFDILQLCQCNLLVLPLSLVCLLARKPMTIVLISAGTDKASKTHTAARLLAGPLDPNTHWLEVPGHTWIDGDLYGIQSAGSLVVNITRYLLKRIGAVMIVLSTRMRLYLKENDFDLPGTQLIPNGVDVIRFHPLPFDAGNTPRTKTVVCVAQARYEKGIDVLLQAWRIVQAEVPESRLIIVGYGPLRTQLEQMAEALGIKQSIEFAGLQSNVSGQLHRGIISVLPSRWEGMPNALLEEMASGLACIATRVSGSEDLIQSGFNGLLVETEDYQGMAQAILKVLKDTKLAQQYGVAARATVEQHYALDKVMNMYTTVYQSLTVEDEHSARNVSTPAGSGSLAP